MSTNCLAWPDPSRYGLAKGEANAGDPYFSVIVVTILLYRKQWVPKGIPILPRKIGTSR